MPFNQRAPGLVPSERPHGGRPTDGIASYAEGMTGTALLAHQGGWDEILLVAAPMLVVAGLLWVAKRRVDRSGPTPDHAPERDEPITR